jgi:tRNA(Ile)-lysidine synthase
MLNKVSDFIAKHRLLSHDDLHLVALSGGADSVALLLILQQLGYRIEAAHCNFHLRGEESDRDEDFVKTLCEKLNVQLHLIHFDTNEYASLHQVSVEMAARELRYGYFQQLCQDIGAATVCVAHHRDDAVETLLMNLLRGSGIHGLTGIRPKNGHIVRPLLCISREEIEQYLHSIGQDYVIDSTNLVDDVVRNKIRLQVLPLLKEINPKAAENIEKASLYLREAEKVFDESIAMQKAELIQIDPKGFPQTVSIPLLLEQPSPEYLLHEWLTPYGFNTTQEEQIFAHLIGESGREFLSPNHTLVIDRDTLVLESRQAPMKTIRIPEEGLYRYNDHFCLDIKRSNQVTISKLSDCITIDAAKVLFPLTLRPVQQGDRFCPFGMEGHRLVSDFLTDCKLSILDKRRQLVVTDRDNQIIWLVGHRCDNRFRVTEQTTEILSLRMVQE